VSAAPVLPPRALKVQAQRALERNRAAEAVTLATQSVAGDPSDAEAWLILGAAYDAQHDLAHERDAYRSCIQQGKGPRVAECRALLR